MLLERRRNCQGFEFVCFAWRIGSVSNGGMRAFECSSQRPNLYRALLKGGEIAVQVGDGFDAAEIIF
jgi:hypothetical protein